MPKNIQKITIKNGITPNIQDPTVLQINGGDTQKFDKL